MGNSEKGKGQFIVRSIPATYQVNCSVLLAGGPGRYEVEPAGKTVKETGTEHCPKRHYAGIKLSKKQYGVTASRKLPGFKEPTLVVIQNNIRKMLQTIYATKNGPFIMTMSIGNLSEPAEEVPV